MTMQGAAGMPGWHVTSQSEYTEIAADGTPVRGIKVYFATNAGRNGSVFVPPGQYNPDTVRAMIAAAAANVDAIGNLTSDS